MIRNVVFDMGNVLLHFDPDLFIRRAGVTEEADALLMKRELFRSLEWVLMDRGSLNEPDTFERLKLRLPERLHGALEELLFRWDQPILPVEGMADFVRDCKEAGYGLYLLSNASRRLHSYWKRVPGHEHFDGRLVSADVGLLKPQPEIYQTFCRTFSLRPEECLFIDDFPMNIEGAVNAGWKGVIFNDAEDLRTRVRIMGLDV